MELATTVLVWLSWLTLGAYVALYSVRPWWRSTTGRAMFGLGLGLFALCTLAVSTRALGVDYAARPVVRLLTWGVVWAISMGLLISWWRAQRRGDDD